jgi:hypothetical protein
MGLGKVLGSRKALPKMKIASMLPSPSRFIRQFRNRRQAT